MTAKRQPQVGDIVAAQKGDQVLHGLLWAIMRFDEENGGTTDDPNVEPSFYQVSISQHHGQVIAVRAEDWQTLDLSDAYVNEEEE